MIYVEGAPTIFLVKEDLSDYVICRDDHLGQMFRGREYLIYGFNSFQELVAPSQLVWWPEDTLEYEDLYES